jgi:cysteine desulfurase/selenocysteine lyase
LQFVPITEEGLLDLDALDALLTPQVKIFAFVHVSNSLGTVNPVAAICRLASLQGITTFVDGAQSAGHQPVNVRELGCDFYAFSGHKMCAPTGIGALYARREILETLPGRNDQPRHPGGKHLQERRG